MLTVDKYRPLEWIMKIYAHPGFHGASSSHRFCEEDKHFFERPQGVILSAAKNPANPGHEMNFW
jgi:hypothetical protein